MPPRDFQNPCGGNNALINSTENKTLCVQAYKVLTLLRIQFESANRKNKILAVTGATRNVILKKPRSSGTRMC